MMRVVHISTCGGPEVLQVDQRPIPPVGNSQILIQVAAAGVNRPDIFQRKGHYPAPAGAPADIPGLEVAGLVVEVGKEVTAFQKGDRVMALLSGGGYSTHAVAEESCCLRIPPVLTMEEAASLPENLYTVWHNVFERGELHAGEKFLVHGGAGGIGYTAVQLAKLFGAEVFTTVSTADKASFVQALGVDHVARYTEVDFSELWKGEQIDVILDSIGGAYFDKNMRVLAEEGRLVYINATDGGKVGLNIFELMQKRITLTGSTLRSRSIAFKSHLTKALQEQVMPYLAAGRFQIQVDRVFPLEQASEAHAYMEASQHIGKIILKP
ncbi:NAD(P)H-quinone oxidoreductase [Sphingobacterium sp. SGG-5]|uniref:NAD(P)H-quinone oxidoreductase n=1 Tax=Sphingobacterium sp. SGG-5 TaxID=2710881 RepID=UPI001F0CECAE|nr:NAD(P)H-quinone oxidoreductase [Sphingobacterium sp. SGG-5]